MAMCKEAIRMYSFIIIEGRENIPYTETSDDIRD